MNNKPFKSGFVSIIGKPNVGKSTFLNTLFGEKLFITSSKPQTTRNRIQGIYTTDTEQIVFIDTPGIHKSNNKLGEVMNEFALSAMEGIDLILLLVDASLPFSPSDELILEELRKNKIPTLLVINKVDKVLNKAKLEDLINKYKASYPFKGGITISAKENFNIDKLKQMIVDNLEEGPMYYPDDQVLDLPERFVVSELIREKVLQLTKEEVPHCVAVTIEAFKQDSKNPNLININATLVCERQSQKSILIGHNGDMIKKIGTEARKDIVKFLKKKVYLELFVKVEQNWRNNKFYLKQFGYNMDDYKK